MTVKDLEDLLDFGQREAFACEIHILNNMVEHHESRMRDACQKLGLVWNGSYNACHLKVIALAYAEYLKRKREVAK